MSVALQRRLCAWVEDQVGLHLADLEGSPPSRAIQLALAGLVVMADWIASCDQLPGLGTAAADLSHARRPGGFRISVAAVCRNVAGPGSSDLHAGLCWLEP